MGIFIFNLMKIHLKMSHPSHRRDLNLYATPEQVD